MDSCEREAYTIERENGEGQGIAFVEGKPLFLQGAMQGERVYARVTRNASRFAQGVATEVLDPSPDRVAPRCPHYEQCGGCTMQHMAYERQLAQKAGRVVDCLARIGDVAEGSYEMLPPIAMRDPWRYRNKALLPIADGRIGFYASNSHDLVEVTDCQLQPEALSTTLRITRETLPPERDLRSLLLRHGGEGALLCALSSGGRRLQGAEAWVSAMRAALPTLAGALHGMSVPSGGEQLGLDFRTLWGESTLRDSLLGIPFTLSPRSFAQVNHRQAEALYTAAMDMAGLDGAERVVDAYCGAGVLTQCLAARAKNVTGIELSHSAVEDARRGAAQNGCTNVIFKQGACEDLLPGMSADVIVLDPPRKGCEEEVLQAIAASGASSVVYISCDPATLARDIARMRAHKFTLQRAQVVDMFPWTAHVETVALLTRASSHGNANKK